jgi:hypothetical protein
MRNYRQLPSFPADQISIGYQQDHCKAKPYDDNNPSPELAGVWRESEILENDLQAKVNSRLYMSDLRVAYMVEATI